MSFYIVSTPIGNLDDLTVRAEKVLKESSIILCEKKERALKLVSHLGLKNLRLISYHDDKVDSIFIEYNKLLNSANASIQFKNDKENQYTESTVRMLLQIIGIIIAGGFVYKVSK